MKVLRMLAGAALAAALGGSTAYAATPVDGYQLVSGPTQVSWEQFDETHEFNTSLQAFPVPNGFQDGTVFLTEAGGGFSDAFTLVNDPASNQVNAYFISDGASADEMSRFITATRTITIPETGNWQDVSDFFGQQPGFAQIISDIDAVPEPATWALMILGFGAIGATLRRHRSMGAFAV